MTTEMECRALEPLIWERQRTASLRWVGVSKEGPGEESTGKERRARSTSSSPIWMGVGGGEGGRVGGGARGCLDSISWSDWGEGGTRPREERAWSAFLN